MQDIVTVRSTADIVAVFKNRAKHITLAPPEGTDVARFLADLTIEAHKLLELEGFDHYEVESILRNMSAPNQ